MVLGADLTEQAAGAIGQVFDDIGVRGFLHAVDLDSGREAGYRADEPVVSASVFKLPVLVELFRQGAEGVIDLTESVTVPVSPRTLGPTGISIMLDPVTMSWRDLAVLMMVVSDNAATDVICSRVGLDRVNASLDRLGLPGTRVDTDCAGIFATLTEDLGVGLEEMTPQIDLAAWLASRAQDPGRTNRTTPRETTALLGRIWRDEAAPASACAEVRRILAQQVWPHRLAAGFPEPDIRTAGKTGTIGVVRNEVGVVEYPDGARYAVAVFARSRSAEFKQPAVDAVIGAAARAAVDLLRA